MSSVGDRPEIGAGRTEFPVWAGSQSYVWPTSRIPERLHAHTPRSSERSPTSTVHVRAFATTPNLPPSMPAPAIRSRSATCCLRRSGWRPRGSSHGRRRRPDRRTGAHRPWLLARNRDGLAAARTRVRVQPPRGASRSEGSLDPDPAWGHNRPRRHRQGASQRPSCCRGRGSSRLRRARIARWRHRNGWAAASWRLDDPRHRRPPRRPDRAGSNGVTEDGVPGDLEHDGAPRAEWIPPPNRSGDRRAGCRGFQDGQRRGVDVS